jgi:hypothetical protein
MNNTKIGIQKDDSYKKLRGDSHGDAMFTMCSTYIHSLLIETDLSEC